MKIRQCNATDCNNLKNVNRKVKIELSDIIKYNEVEEKVISVRGQDVIIDNDVARLYGVETKRINEAVKNNPDKFPDNYIIPLTLDEWDSLRSKFSTLKNTGRGQHTKYVPTAFTEKGLYMLATILKSSKATQTTIAIVEVFTKMRELSRVVGQISEAESESQQKILMRKSGEILSGILDDDALEVSGDETTLEINLAFMKIKHTVKRDKR